MQIKDTLIFFSVILLLLFVSCQKEEIVIRVVDPLCENRINPLGIDVLSPRFSWKLESTQRGKIQSAYQIIVADSEEKLSGNNGNLWNSKKIISNQSIQIKYKGKNHGNDFWFNSCNF